MRSRLLCALALAILATAGCARRGSVDPKAPIIIISIDTLRSDHLPAYGYTKVETPAIDAFRKDAVLFEHAYSQCPLTLVSHASVFTGLLPAEHGIRDNLGYALDPKAKTIAELLKSNGYATGGAVSAVVLRGESGIKRGFDYWEDSVDLDPGSLSIGRAQRSGDATRELAQKWISEKKEKPFFFFLHLYEPHSPYEPPEPFKSRYGNTYDGEVATADDIVGKFVDYLKSENLYDRATIILMSDHGEGLGEHGEAEHGVLLYRETLQVPLMIKLPHERQKGTSVASPAELIDIFPTIVQAFPGAPKSEGASLLDLAAGKVKEQRDIYAETYYPRFHFGWNDLHSIIAGSKHYIHAHKSELYDLAADPAELKNVLLDDRRTYVAMRDRIQPYIHAAAAPSLVDDEQKQQLIALGYVGSTVSTDASAELPDPKENIGKANLIGVAFRDVKEEKFDDAIKVTGELLRDNPNMADVWMVRARALGQMNRREEAIEAAKQGLKVSPSSSALAALISQVALELKQYDVAEQHARLLLKETPFEAHRLLANIDIEKKDYAKAREEAKLTVSDPNNGGPVFQMLMGRIDLAQGNVEQALKSFNESMRQIETGHHKVLPKLNFFMGDALARLGRNDEAERAFRSEIKLFPSDPEPYRNLVLLCTAEGKTQEATELIFALEKSSPTPPSYVAIAETLKIIGDRNGSRFWAARGLNRYPSDRQLQVLVRG